jgi:hypothetical protein
MGKLCSFKSSPKKKFISFVIVSNKAKVKVTFVMDPHLFPFTQSIYLCQKAVCFLLFDGDMT